MDRFILQKSIKLNQIKQAAVTFIGFTVNKFQNLHFSQIDGQNNYLMQKFRLAVIGDQETKVKWIAVGNQQQGTNSLSPIEFQSDSVVYMRDFQTEGKLHRLLYFPAESYMVDSINCQKPQIEKSCFNMIKKFFLLNSFLLPSVTQKIKPIMIQYLPKPLQGRNGHQNTVNILKKYGQIINQFKAEYQLNLKQFPRKFSLLLCTQNNIERFQVDAQSVKCQRIELLLFTNDKKLYSLKLYKKGQQLKQFQKKIILSELENSDLFQAEENGEFLKFDKFSHLKQKIDEKSIIRKKIVQDLWRVIEWTLYPLLKVRSKIYTQYGLKQDILSLQQKWSCTNIANSLQQFNLNFSSPSFKRALRTIQKMNKINIEERKLYCQFQYSLISGQIPAEKSGEMSSEISREISENIGSEKQILSFFEHFKSQKNNFLHPITLDSINTIHKQVKSVWDQQNEALGFKQLIKNEKKLLEFGKLIIHLLSQLKTLPLFQQILKNYEPQLCEHILDLFCGAYIEFCSLNQQEFAKFYNLSQKLLQLSSCSEDILRIVEKVKIEIPRERGNGLNSEKQRLKDQRLKYEKLRKILNKYQPRERNNTIQIKKMQIEYTLGILYYVLGKGQLGKVLEKELKASIKMLFLQLYLNLFLKKNPFLNEYRNSICFTELELLEKTSSVLKLINRLDLAIQIEKKIGNIKTVQNYYKRWLMSFNKYNPQENQKMILILQSAINYSKKMFLQNDVKSYYEELIIIAKTQEEKVKWKREMLSYMKELVKPEKRFIAIEEAQKDGFSLDEILPKIRGLFPEFKNSNYD